MTTKLQQELERLFFLPEQAGMSPERLSRTLEGKEAFRLALLNPDRQLRTLVVGITDTRAWKAVAALYEGVQEQWAWPAPAVSVSPEAGFQIWFSLTEAILAPQAERLLIAMKEGFLSDLSATSLQLLPSPRMADPEVALVPSLHPASGHWSAFIDPTMVSMFADQTGLEFAPNLARQADMLATVQSITPQDLQRALTLLDDQASGGMPAASPQLPQQTEPCPEPPLPSSQPLNPGSNFTDPKAFLLAVMNDPQVSIQDRIQTASALLPYCEK